MPGGDRNGPLGQGPGTGRALGYCYGYDTPGYMKGTGRGMGRGMRHGRGSGYGWGFGRGWGFSRCYPGQEPGCPGMPSISREDEIRMLKTEADSLKRSQKDIEKRLSELEKEE